jgi:signal transduction histidine kinase
VCQKKHDVSLAGKKIADLINNLKNFASLDQAMKQRIDIRPGIENTIALLKPQFSERIKIIKKLGSIPAIECYPQELNQVFMTLLLNASEAVSSKGSITIETERGNGFITIKLSDTGKGIAENQLNKIFEIGFSEKNKSMRMHVGLANCFNIIQKHNGEISVQSKLGRGTTFLITLPLSIKS